MNPVKLLEHLYLVLGCFLASVWLRLQNTSLLCTNTKKGLYHGTDHKSPLPPTGQKWCTHPLNFMLPNWSNLKCPGLWWMFIFSPSIGYVLNWDRRWNLDTTSHHIYYTVVTSRRWQPPSPRYFGFTFGEAIMGSIFHGHTDLVKVKTRKSTNETSI